MSPGSNLLDCERLGRDMAEEVTAVLRAHAFRAEVPLVADAVRAMAAAAAKRLTSISELEAWHAAFSDALKPRLKNLAAEILLILTPPAGRG